MSLLRAVHRNTPEARQNAPMPLVGGAEGNSDDCPDFDTPRRKMNRNTRVYAFGYYGGKLSHLSRLLPLLPKCQTYVEPFGGSAAVLLNREPSSIEVYNDLDGDLVTFFKVLREHPDELIRLLSLTPFSRREYAQSCEVPLETSELERARLFFVRHNQSFANIPIASPGRWGYCITNSRRGMSGIVSAWHGNIDNLEAVASRLLSVQIECAPAIEVVQRYDTDDTLYFVDPPYPNGVREASSRNAYLHEMSDGDHIELAAELRACSGKVAISGYDCELYEQLFAGWCRTMFRQHHTASSNNKRKRVVQEVLWTNYDPTEVTGQQSLFSSLAPQGE